MITASFSIEARRPERRHLRRASARVLGLLLALVSPLAAAGGLAMDALDQPAPVIGIGDGRTLQDLRGRWVLLHFWATWCEPCRTELPALDRLAQRWRDRIDVYAVSIDDGDPAPVAAYVAAAKLSLPVVNREVARATERYWGWGVPVSYLIDPQGQLVGRILGPRDWAASAVDDELRRLTHLDTAVASP